MDRASQFLLLLGCLVLFIELISSDDIFPEALDLPSSSLGRTCFFRCLAANCNSEDPKSIKGCSENSGCKNKYDDLVCRTEECTNTCNGDFPTANPDITRNLNISADYAKDGLDPNFIEVEWDAVEGASLYILQYRIATDTFHQWRDGGKASMAVNANKQTISIPSNLCLEFEFRVGAVLSDGIVFNPSIKLEKPVPRIDDPGFQWVKTTFAPNYGILPRVDGTKTTNPSAVIIEAKLKYPKYWDPKDIWIETKPGTRPPDATSHTFIFPRCSIANLNTITKFIPENQTVQFILQGKEKNGPETGCECDVAIINRNLRSKKCGTHFNFPANARLQYKYGSTTPDCLHDVKIKSVLSKSGKAIPMTKEGIPSEFRSKIDKNNVTLRIEWTKLDISRRSDENKIPRKPLYYIVNYGLKKKSLISAISIVGQLASVDKSGVIGNLTVCQNRPISQCKNQTLVSGLNFNESYAIAVCSIFKPISFKDRGVISSGRGTAVKLKFAPPPNKRGTIVMAIVIPLTFALLFFLLVVACLVRRTVLQRRKMEQLNADFNREREDVLTRYTELPKRNDVWELDRKKLIVYEDQKLGSGAFGSVFKGKVVGKLKAHKDAESNLATYLMKIENSEVAVKMLPEYADELSKADFLKEINLMKSLGHHDQLVNMLACTTESEPYCLIVELCSDGDLLHFLRDRRKYMMKLDDMGIDYRTPGEEVDPDMVLSLKELLGFSLQVSYGLDYLSSKGFIHRDVAARNVLVNEKRYAKIGDFGLCRYVLGADTAYWGKGGRLPIKWMAPEAIKNYEFSIQSDIWSFGILLFEIITMGGCPYPGIQPADMEAYLDEGGRMEQPDNCPDNFYEVMMGCWEADPEKRFKFGESRTKLAKQLEDVTAEYSYLNLDSGRDYYNVAGSEYRTGDGVLDDELKPQSHGSTTDIPPTTSKPTTSNFPFDFPHVVVEPPNSPPTLDSQKSDESQSATIVGETGSRKVSSDSLAICGEGNFPESTKSCNLGMGKIAICKTDSGIEAKGSDSVSMSSTDASPPALRKRALDSATSDFQLTPVNQRDRHFSFSGSKNTGPNNPFSNELDQIVETSDGTVTSGDDLMARSPGFTNPLYSDVSRNQTDSESKV